ncbi:hypothetical protein FOA52_014010 [Chlamydomonas sp. UWO 241]|nr:hypothetical protein FOA52_014010 [Chlamydomonas sp. UWO 241]
MLRTACDAVPLLRSIRGGCYNSSMRGCHTGITGATNTGVPGDPPQPPLPHASAAPAAAAAVGPAVRAFSTEMEGIVVPATGTLVRSRGQTEMDPSPGTPYEPALHPPTYIVYKKGMELLRDAWYNKGTAFPYSERDRLGLRGLVPPRCLTLETQERRFMEGYQRAYRISENDAKVGGVSNEMIRRWKLLQQLQDRNETLFYKVLINNFVDIAPIIYTPTVGWACVNYHHLYRRPRGMFFSADDMGEMAAMAWNWPQDNVAAIVVTDGSRILGLGDLGVNGLGIPIGKLDLYCAAADLGVNGLGIPIGKLDLYCAAAGFSPAEVLPVVLDVGTNNQQLLDDPFYMGLRKRRITGAAYYDVVDEFVAAVMARWPNAVLQFEDFSMNHALTLLDRYREHHLVFNDDIQGTAATALAGLYGALRVLGKPVTALTEQRIVVVGAGSAGMGVTRMIASGMCKQGLTFEEATQRFWVIDNQGLITNARDADLPAHVRPFARDNTGHEGESLVDVIKRVQPTILLGLAGAGRLFTEEVMSTMNEACTDVRPIVFAMSNPFSKMEVEASDAVRWTNGRVIYASGSPQPPVCYGGANILASQANNMYIFPGIALGAYLGATKTISDLMLMTAAEKLPELITDEDLAQGLVYPQLSDIRQISARIAASVIKAAAEEGKARGKALEKIQMGDEQLMLWLRRKMFEPKYASLVQLPVGVMQ